MKILADLEESIKLNKIVNMPLEKVKDAFCANYLAALVFLKLQDLKGLQLINDPKHAALKSWSNEMNDLNFWGKVLFYPEDKEVKKRLLKGHADVLAQESSKILDSRVQALMKVPLTAPHLICWDEVCAMLTLLKYRFEIISSYYSKSLRILCSWDKASANDKSRIISYAFTYLLQSDPQSESLELLRAIHINHFNPLAVREARAKIINFFRISEDGEGVGGSATVVGTGTGNIGSSSNAIIGGSAAMQHGSGSTAVNKESDLGGLYKLDKKSPWQMTKTVKVGKFIFRGGKPIKKKVKRWNPIKFKAPPHMKVTKDHNKEKKDDHNQV